MELNYIQIFILENSKLILSRQKTLELPSWANESDQSEPVAPSNFGLSYEPVNPDVRNRDLKVGDKLNTVFTLYPQVRLDGNVVVKFSAEKVEVLRESGRKKSLITGLARSTSIRKAKATLGKDMVKIEISAIYECLTLNQFSLAPFKTIGDITIKLVKI